MGNAQDRYITWEQRNDTEKGNLKLNFTKQFCHIYCSAKYSPWKGDCEKIQNIAFACTCMKNDPSAAVRVIVSLSLPASVVTAKRELNIDSLYI